MPSHPTVHVLLLGALVSSAAAGALLPRQPARVPEAYPEVRVEIVDQGVLPGAWPATASPASEVLTETAFGFYRLPWRYTGTGVRADRPVPFLMRASGTVTLPAGEYRVLLRARGAARLRAGGVMLAELEFPKRPTDGHEPVRHDFLDLGPQTRYRGPGDRELLVPYRAPGGAMPWSLECIVGGKRDKDDLRPELGETLVAVAPLGSNDFRLLAPREQIPLTDAGWTAYRSAREARWSRLEAGRRSAARAASASYWRMRHQAAREHARRNPVPVPPAVAGMPARNTVDRFLNAGIAAARQPGAPSPDERFNREVLPLLTRRCFSCHGASGAGGLRLTTREGALKPGASGRAAIVPGRPEESLLLARVQSTDPQHAMPPAGERLSEAEVRGLREWIAAGAEWSTPSTARTRVAFSPQLPDLPFLRRVTLDLAGTAPTVPEIRAFVADAKRDPRGARARVIDRLLADPRWANPWVAYWQDVLAENPNLINATLNNTGPFRWWLYESFLDNKPLDLFVTELIRMEGSPYGGAPAGFGLAAMNDAPMVAKANILGTAFLGTEMKCARCHDAPYHPSTQADLFHMAAMLAREPVAVPATSTVPAGKFAGRTPRIRISLHAGDRLSPDWPLTGLVKNDLPAGWLQDPGNPRERLAALVTAPWNERFAEVLVNRVWARYMGRGLVEPVHDWSNPQSSHPELLRWLAREMISHDYDLKHVTRLILNSHAYGRQARRDAEANRLFAAPTRRKLTAEQLVDSLFDSFGRRYDVEQQCIDLEGARPPKLGLDFGVPQRAWQLVYAANDRDRPSLSLPRVQAVAELLTAFGWTGNRQEAIQERKVDPTLLQPALLENGTASLWLTRLSEDSELTAVCLAARTPAELVDTLYLRVLSRPPTPAERQDAVALLTPGFATRKVPARTGAPTARKPPAYVDWGNHLQTESNEIRTRQAREARLGPPPAPRLTREWRERAEDLLWALLNAPEVVYVP